MAPSGIVVIVTRLPVAFAAGFIDGPGHNPGGLDRACAGHVTANLHLGTLLLDLESHRGACLTWGFDFHPIA